MKQIKRRLVNILHRELLIDKSLITEQARLEKNLAMSPSELNLLLYYFERDMKMNIPDEHININQNIAELTSSLYQIKKSYNKLQRA